MAVCPFPLNPVYGAETFQYSDRYNTVISADENGFIEFWQPFEPFEPPKNIPGMWSFKSSTDLYEFKKVCPHLIGKKGKMLDN